jgi:cobalt/nickel transport system permease protein
MLFAHLVLAGPLEAVVTALVVRYLQSYNVDLMNIQALSAASAPSTPVSYRKFWWALGVLIVLSPLGLLASGTAWGEWGAEELQKMLGFIPAGMQRLADTWSHAPFGDYSLPGLESFWSSAFIYILCGILGVGIISLLTYLFWRFQLAEGKGKN